MDIKKLFIAFVLFVLSILLSVIIVKKFDKKTQVAKNNTTEIVNQEQNRISIKDRIIINGYIYLIVCVDDHEYLNTESGVVHLESCKCKKH